MGIYDRPYWKQPRQGGPSGGLGNIRLALPTPTRGVIGLIVACTVLFFATLATGRHGSPLYAWLSLASGKAYRVWTFLTFQLMHAAPGHFLWNMVGLYFFGPPLERLWGTKRFLVFYLVCGMAGGLCFLVLALFWTGFGVLVGASGGILACLMACAILFPQMLLIVFPIRWVAAFFVVLYVLNIAWSGSGGDAAHLGGMLAAAAWVFGLPKLTRSFSRASEGIHRGAWQRKLNRQADQQAEIDRILRKIHERGLGGLSGREKKILRDATEHQREEEDELTRL